MLNVAHQAAAARNMASIHNFSYYYEEKHICQATFSWNIIVIIFR